MDIRIVNPKLYRGPRPTSAIDVGWLYADRGIRRIVNLQGTIFESAKVAEEMAWATDSCIDFRHCPLSIVTPPDAGAIAAILALLASDPAPTYLHCHDGVDRTGVICAALRVASGATFGEAVGEMIDDGFHLKPYAAWLPFLQAELTTR
jgi:protein tyrosine/serine phosphatase